ncbi:MAG: hypothetical protein A2169_06920 [Deltaproteobacteria bacterium RBG_13_47_9]|nr:MAG: hypothetical protein A2169_06920 [Deltaproteobacteria bacterium RBG_13_47_9]
MSLKLSLCIPAFNRGPFIGETLESIISQAADEVEIVIVDGASTDNTQDIVSGYQRRFSRLRYYRGEQNMGFDRDLQKSVELAEGEYCWLMCSDDVLRTGAIAAVMDAIRQGHALIIVNAEVRNQDLSKILQKSILQGDADRVYKPEDAEEFFIDTASYLSYLGAIIIKKPLWDSREKQCYLDTALLHTGVVFQSPIPTTALVLAAPLISIRYGNATWSPRAFEIGAFHWPKIIWSFRDYSDSAKSQVCMREGWRDIRMLIFHRATGAFSTKEYDHWIRPYSGYRYSKLLARGISVIPGRFLNFLCVVYFTMRSNRGAQLVDLKRNRFYWLKRFSRIPSPTNS